MFPSLQKLIAKKRRENEARGSYNPILPGFGSILDMKTAEYLEAFGSVQDNASKDRVPFRVETVNERMTRLLLGYIDDPGFDRNGLPYWKVLVSGRQSTKSTVATYGLYAKAAREPGTEAFILADTNPRSEYLYQRALQLHSNLPDRIRPPMHLSGVSKGLRFAEDVGGSLSFYSAERKGGMIGFSGKIGQISEIPFMHDPAKMLSVLLPALYHQTKSRLTLESTPAPPTYNGAAYWKNLVLGGMAKDSRFKVDFSPWWESLLNRSIWPDGWQLDNSEIDLLNLHGHNGLTKENLAYRRMILATDAEIKRYPDLFGVWYPSSLTTCWGGGSIGMFPDNVMKKHLGADYDGRMSPRKFENHRLVVIGCDPAGLLGGADHAAFTVLGCDQTDWSVEEVYSANVTVHEYVDALIETATRYQAETGKWPVIAVESNGAGAATLALLIERNYPRIYCESRRRPGITASKPSNKRLIAQACDALMDDFRPIWSLPLVMQGQSYSGDRMKRTTEMSTLINGLAKGRRERHHWDLWSSFMLAIEAARNTPLPRAPVVEVPIELKVRAYTSADYDKLRAMEEADERKRRGRKR